MAAPDGKGIVPVVDIIEIYVDWEAGRSKGELAMSLAGDRETVMKSLAPAELSGIILGGPPRSEDAGAKMIKSWFPERADGRLRQFTWDRFDKLRDYISSLFGAVTDRRRRVWAVVMVLLAFRHMFASSQGPGRRPGRWPGWSARAAVPSRRTHSGRGELRLPGRGVTSDAWNTVSEPPPT
ncbi:hypothetical protein AB0D11_40045 [Streptomyces monashensis]|uniref:hypothetical protein n=1 Tax=Streptomyces monashensis TaxID=1678012 RepID=UPI0033DC10C8